MNIVKKTIRERPIISSLILTIVGVVIAFALACIVTADKLKETLRVAGVTLLFGAFLGGIVKILFEDYQRKKERRDQQARFTSNILDDLKSVYDRVERSRTLIPAHQSAKTYGEEMRDLIEARVKLLNVKRALMKGDSGLKKENEIVERVDEMQKHLKKLTDEFKENYRPIAILQEQFESKRDKWLENPNFDKDTENNNWPENLAWEELKRLPELRDFIGLSPDETNHGSGQEKPRSVAQDSDYIQKFRDPLDRASELLSNELRNPEVK